MKLIPAEIASGPARILAFNQFFSSVGLGAFLAGSTLFFIKIIGLTPAEVGIGGSVAGMVGLLATVPAGRIADRFGPRNLAIGFAFAEAGLVAIYAWTRSFVVFLLVICLLALVEKAAAVVRNTLLVGLFGREGRLSLKALMRSLFNAGFAIGALFAAIPLHLGSRSAYLALVVGYSATTLVTAVLLTRIPATPPSHGGVRRPWSAVRDTRFIAVAVTCGAVSIHGSVLHIALPLWISEHTPVNPSAYSVLLVLNTVLVVLLQVRFSRGSRTVTEAGQSVRRAAIVLLPVCVLFGLATTLPRWPALIALVIGAIGLTVAELMMTAAIWTIGFDLADPASPGEYQGAFALGMSVESVLGPLLVVFCITSLGTVGWWVIGAFFVALGLLLPVLLRVAKAQRPHLIAAESPSA